ncbi:hypothetical protein [Leucobacter aridicollis]|uniref:hypothetical protein n=1 Tax=Leucobacter aridicollis TaxID=283878 RepID=UPI002105EA70|nr:hypothetical protein [Leucobacter aridicollis]UTX53373.1 hypothetical protein KI794_01000 [Leucobacter aridicollis]
MYSKVVDATRDEVSSVRELLLIWRNPETRKYSRVARLDLDPSEGFLFRYLEEAHSLEGFYPLDEYPELDTVYSSDSLPVFFTNRIMSPSRPGYDDYLKWLGLEDLSSNDIPLEVLARTGGGRATDTFHVVEAPSLLGGAFESRFFVSGLRHADVDLSIIKSVQAGDTLMLRPDPENPVNQLAMIIDTVTGQQLGWLPDWLCNEVAMLEANEWTLSLEVERVNPEAPPRSMVLCKLTAVSA